jgi:hypothetical protein
VSMNKQVTAGIPRTRHAKVIDETIQIDFAVQVQLATPCMWGTRDEERPSQTSAMHVHGGSQEGSNVLGELAPGWLWELYIQIC